MPASRWLLMIVCLAGTWASAGTLSTRSGQFFQGEIQFADGADGTQRVNVITSDGSFPLSFKLSDVASLSFRPPWVGVLSGGVLPGGWGVRDVGTSLLAGSANFNQGLFELRGEGTSFGHLEDSFQFTWQAMPYEGQILARLAQMPDHGKQALAGLMIRSGLGSLGRYCFIGVSADGKSQFIFKPNATTDEATIIPGPAVKLPCWLKLVKTRDRVIGSVSTDGTTPANKANFQFIGRLDMEGLFHSQTGMIVTSRQSNELATARFDHVLLQRKGLKAEFFADNKWTDPRATRIDPTIDFTWGMGSPEVNVPSEFWARWSGTLEPTSSDNYTFVLNTAEPAQLWIDDQKVLDNTSRLQRSGAITLQAEHRYHIRVEYHRARQEGILKLMWAAQNQPLQVVPSEVFAYRQDAEEAMEHAAVTPLQRFVPMARGALLSDGSFLPGTVVSLLDGKLTFKYRDRTEMAIPIEQIARLTFQPLANAMIGRIGDKSTGLLTQQGDFIEGECQSISGNDLKMNSVVFGVSSFDIPTQAGVMVFRAATPGQSGWLIRTTSGAVLRAKSFVARKSGMLLQGMIAGDIELNWDEMIDVQSLDRG